MGKKGNTGKKFTADDSGVHSTELKEVRQIIDHLRKIPFIKDVRLGVFSAQGSHSGCKVKIEPKTDKLAKYASLNVGGNDGHQLVSVIPESYVTVYCLCLTIKKWLVKCKFIQSVELIEEMTCKVNLADIENYDAFTHLYAHQRRNNPRKDVKAICRTLAQAFKTSEDKVCSLWLPFHRQYAQMTDDTGWLKGKEKPADPPNPGRKKMDGDKPDPPIQLSKNDSEAYEKLLAPNSGAYYVPGKKAYLVCNAMGLIRSSVLYSSLKRHKLLKILNASELAALNIPPEKLPKRSTLNSKYALLETNVIYHGKTPLPAMPDEKQSAAAAQNAMTQSDLSGLLEILQQIQDSAIENNAMLKQLIEKLPSGTSIPWPPVKLQEFLKDPQKVLYEAYPEIKEILTAAERIKNIFPN